MVLLFYIFGVLILFYLFIIINLIQNNISNIYFRSSQTSLASTNPFDDDYADTISVSTVGTVGTIRSRKKRRAPPPPVQVSQ